MEGIYVSIGNLDNCPRCGALFVKTVRDVCQKCYQQIEKEYETCATFLRKKENRGVDIYQLSEATGVSVKQITRFIKEGRISVRDNPNMGYPCERCGGMIRIGNLCEACAKSMRREFEQQLELDKRLEEHKQEKTVSYWRRAQGKRET
jgi:flagellar operon protein (TIGR03826 family)